MRKLLFCSFLTFLFTNAFAQPYGNEWIKSDQKYFKIKIGRTGIYRIDYPFLVDAAQKMQIDLSTVNPKKWQMFYKGVEIPIYVAGENDNVFNSNDFIEFFARTNDGELDKDLYRDPRHLANPITSMITDTSCYYLTFIPTGSSQTAKHMSNYVNKNFGSISPESYFQHQSIASYTSNYVYGEGFDLSGSEASDPLYKEAEGFSGTLFGSGTSYSSFLSTIETRFLNSTGPSPTLDFVTVGANNNIKVLFNDHRMKVYVSQDNFGFTEIHDTTFDGFRVIRKSLKLGASQLGSNNTYLKFEGQFISGVAYQAHAVNTVSITYSRNFDLDGNSSFLFRIKGNNSPKHIHWQNYTSTKTNPFIYDLTNGYRIMGDKYTGTDVRFIIPGSNTEGEYYIHDSFETNYLSEKDIYPSISYEVNSSFSYLEYLKFDPTKEINKNKLVLLTHPKFMGDYASEYLQLRNATSITPNTMVSINQLYEHFSYGVPHPIAIKRYLRYLKENGDTSLKFLFLVGRGYQTNMVRGVGHNKNIIPSIGVPASDNLFATDINGSGNVPVVAIGRLTVDKASEFGIYVKKLMEYESSSNEFWKKKVLHLAGGENGNQAAYIKMRMDYAGSFVTQCPFGGNVSTYTKSSIGISEPFLKQKAIENVNAGLQMINFLGHGSAAVTDIDIGDTIEYNNAGKYPVFYFNGCSIGNPCLGPPDKNIKLSGENFMKAHNKGAIAFIAQSSLSELSNVDNQIMALYRNVFRDKFNGSYTIGETIQDVIKIRDSDTSPMNRIQARILFVQGDPSLSWFQPQSADYSITDKSIWLFPENTTAVSDSFAVAVAVENKGKCIDDSFNIKIERSYPNNFLVTEHNFRVPGVGYSDTFYLYIKSKDAATAGNNKFVVTINPDHQPDESDYTNNVATLNQLIPGNGVNLVYPKRFDIISRLNNDTVEMVAQALNLFDKNNLFHFEIDTSYKFDSPWKKADSTLSIVGQIKTWKVKLLGTRDSIVYYWRAKIRTGADNGGGFEERSFIHIFDNEPGWSQSHFPQFYPSSVLNNVILDKNTRRFNFTQTSEKIFINCWLDKKPNFGIKKGGYGALSLNPGAADGVVAILFDKNSLEQFKLPGIFNTTRYYGLNYYEDALKVYNFNITPTWEHQFLAWVDSIPDSTYVALCNVGQMRRPSCSQAVVDAFAKLGSSMFELIQTDLTSFAMIGKKGAAPGMAMEDTGHYNDGTGGYIEIEKDLIGRRDFGTLRTEIIGPTTDWGNIYFYTKSNDPGFGDNFFIDIHGVTNAGEDSIVMSNVFSDNIDLFPIDSKRFPTIYLEGYFEDNKFYTPPQLKHWRVTAGEVPEGTLNSNISNLIWRDTLRQGEEFKYELVFQNISKLSFTKNLKYQVQIYNVDSKDTVYNKTFYNADSLKPDKYFNILTSHLTKTMRGRYAYLVKVNYDNFGKSIIPERSMVNNSILRYFYVVEDRINPLLDVTFDGKHIGNGEIVSSNPTIYISSKDENTLNWQTDTNGIKIWLKRPNSSTFERIDFNTSDVKFYPATSSYNLAKAEFKPGKLTDGIYTLKVQSNDANGTNAGITEYMINFTVINQASATNFYPYPNPCTNAMRFVFTLTGTEVPDYINIKIMTIQGKVVKELNREDLGDIHIGNNITDIVWDGTDEFGDRLSNGVYLYTVTIKINGQEVTQIQSESISSDLNADKANNDMFKHSIGKIVLLR